MASASKDKGSGRKGARALDYVKTQQRVGAGLEEKAAGAKAKEASRREGADPTHDSPKRHGDKLEKARDAAAGRGKGK
jgi:hypothetical protein